MGFIGLIFVIIVIASLVSATGALFSGFFSVGIPILIIYSIIKAFSKKNNKPLVFNKAKTNTSADSHSYLTSMQQTKINNTLRDYFESHDRIAVTGDITLRPANGQYTTIRDLAVYKGDDQVANLSEFKGNYGKFYRNVLDLLMIFSQQGVNDTKVYSKKTEKVETAEAQPVKQTKPNEYDSANEYIDRINALNNDITSEEISNGLYQITSYLTQISLIEKKFPKTKEKLKKVYHYYLPILIGILDQYKNFQDTAKNTEEIKKSEDKLIKTIILINGALKKITETICADELVDLNANMTTLGMLLKNDGLVEDDKLLLGGKKDDTDGR